MKAAEFTERNSQSLIYKGLWNSDGTKITFWFEDGGKATLTEHELKKVTPIWYSSKSSSK